MSERRPHLASLWLGATITPLLPRIFQVSQSFLPTIYLEAVTWTRSPQSFMDPSNHVRVKTRRAGDKVMISREDEFRLLFVTDTSSDTYRIPPLCPYHPFGEVDLQHTSLEVRLHFSCNHRLAYRSWEWRCQNRESLSDFGAPNDSHWFLTAFKPNSLPSIWMFTGITCTSIFNKSLWTRDLMQRHNGSILFSGGLALICLLRRPMKVVAYKKFLTACAWMKKVISIATSKIALNLGERKEEKEAINDRLSELGTRNMFSWTFFAEGIRIEEKPLWEHEWLKNLLE